MRTLVRSQEFGRRRAKNASKVPTKVRLVIKATPPRNLLETDRLTRTTHKVPRTVQANQKQIVVGCVTSSMQKTAVKLTPTHARLGSHLLNAQPLCKTFLHLCDRPQNARIDLPYLSIFLCVIVHSNQHRKRQLMS